MRLQGCLVVVESAEADGQQLVVQFWPSLLWWQFHTDVIAGKTVHGPAAHGFFEKYLCLLTDMALVESVGLFVRQS